MTCIVGLLDGSRVILGGDTCGSDGFMYESCDHSKVFKVDKFVLGGTTSFRMLDLLEHSLKIPYVKPEDESNMDKFMRTSFVTAVRSCLKDGGFAETKNGAEAGGTFLIGYKNKLWRMQDDFSIINRNVYDSVGSGMYTAIGSLYTTNGIKMKPEDRVVKALEAAASLIASVKGPYNLISTEE